MIGNPYVDAIRTSEKIAEWKSDPNVKAIIFRGAGDNFNTGADIKWLAKEIAAGRVGSADEFYEQEYSAYLELNELSQTKPVVSLVDGHVIGSRSPRGVSGRTRLSAYFTGPGEASVNIAPCSGNSRSCSARARA